MALSDVTEVEVCENVLAFVFHVQNAFKVVVEIKCNVLRFFIVA